MTLCRENNFIVTSFLTNECLNYCAVVNLETESVEIAEPPFG